MEAAGILWWTKRDGHDPVIAPGRTMKRRSALLRGDGPPVLGNRWYVDNAVPAPGNGRSWATAWRSFDDIGWQAIRPGDVIYISGGNIAKIYRQTLKIDASGAPGRPIRITPGVDPGHDGEVILDGEDTLTWGVDANGDNHVILEKITVQRFRRACIAWWNSTDVTIRDCAIDTGIGSNVRGENARGLDLRNLKGCTVRGNFITTAGFTPCQTDGVWSNGNTDIVIEDNWIEILNANDDGHSDGIQSYLDNSITIRRNTVIGPSPGGHNHVIWFSNLREGHTLLCYSNVLWARGAQYNATFWRDREAGFAEQGTFKLFNNTIVGGSRGLTLEHLSDIHCRNNIIVPSPGGVGIRLVGIMAPTTRVTCNLIWAPRATVAWTDRGERSWSQLLAEGWNAGGVNADPRFTDPAYGDFTLRPGSPAIGAGERIPEVETNRLGRPRLRRSGYDIGAL